MFTQTFAYTRMKLSDVETIIIELSVFRDLFAWDAYSKIVVENYKANRQYMHAIAADMIAEDLKLT